MGFTEGVVWSLLGAVAHTVIDVLRKFAAQRLPPADLISLLTIYNAAFAVLGVWLIDGGLPSTEELPNPSAFATAVVATAVTGLTAAVLYQRALSIAPLSLTVPYLAFAPVFVVFVSPMFLVGEFPSAMGLAGVALVSLAGYKLGVLGASDTAAAAAAQTQLSGSKAAGAKARAALLPIGSPATNGTASTAAGKPPRHLVVSQASDAEQLPLVAAAGSDGAWEQQQQGSRAYQRQAAQLEPPEACSAEQHTPGDAAALQQQQQQQPQHALHRGPAVSLQQHHHLQLHSEGGSSSSRGGALRHKSAWAIAYYKQKSPQVGVWEAACGDLQSAAQQLLATAGMSPGSGAAGSAANVFGAGGSSSSGGSGLNGLQHLQHAGLSSGSSSGSSGLGLHSYIDSQAKAGKDPKLLDSKRSTSGPLAAASASAATRKPLRRRLPLWLRSPFWRLQQLVRGPAALLSGPSGGPALVLIVAFLYSITASMDKLGMSSSSSTAFYIMMQRVLIAAISLAYLLAASPRTLRHLWKDGVLLLTMSLAEQAAIVLYFKAIQNILVSYMVAIKRINVLLSVLVGCVLFKERVGRRVPYILLMLLGMLLIVLQPGHEALHHSHHTH